MKKLVIILLIFVCSFALTTIVSANDTEDVKAAVLAVDEAFSNADVKKIIKYLHPESSIFPTDGGLLRSVYTEDELNTWFESGFKFDSQARHINIKFYGNTSVVTYYTVEETTQPDGSATQSTVRATEIWIKQKGNWMRVHIHSSLLTPVQE